MTTQGREGREASGRGGAKWGTTGDSPRLSRRMGGLSPRPFALCLTLFALAGCGSDDEGGGTPRPEDDPPTGPERNDPDGDDRPGLVIAGLDGQSAEGVTSPWLVSTTVFRNASDTPPTGEASVGLLRYEDDFPFARHADFFESELDTCELRRGGIDASGGGSPPPRVGGGETVTINAPSGPWLMLERQPLDDGTGGDYRRPFGEWPGELPEGATLSIPGDEFPNVAAYPLVEPPSPIRLLPDEDEPLGADTVYTWIPGGGTDHMVLAFLASEPGGGDFIDFPLVCSVVDDGRFELPEAARAFVATATDELELRYERVRRTLELADGIVFFTSLEVAE